MAQLLFSHGVGAISIQSTLLNHAFLNALIDTLVRYQRMQGRNALWLPGTDNARIAEQTIHDRQLTAEDKARAD